MLLQCLIILVASQLLTGCGVIFGGSKYMARIQVKDHNQAEIFFDGNKIGTGSANGLFRRDQPLVLTLKEDGCEAQTITYHNTFRTGNFVLSLVTWGLVGPLVDVATGACFKPDHKHNPAIQKLSDKNYIFMVDYTGCPTKYINQ